MAEQSKLAIIGAGAMGSALARGIIGGGFVPPRALVVVDPNPHKTEPLERALACRVANDLALEPLSAEIVVLAVKPQDAAAVCGVVGPKLETTQLALSVMAGVETATLSRYLGAHALVVRSMPNLPVQVGRGMTVFYAAPAVGKREIALVHGLFSCCGLCLQVAHEDLLNASTAVNGTGPAYLYYLMENLLAATMALGFDEQQAATLVRQTLQGALELWEATGMPPKQLRDMVTSPGGTTAAAVSTFEAGKLGEVLQGGIHAACQRASELAEVAQKA